jgi:hypothetical protein
MAGGIVGPPFEDWVSQQIDVRQKLNRLTNNKLTLLEGQEVNQYDVLRYQNANTAFLRLSSGVNISDSESMIGGIDSALRGNKLAKSFQLFSTRFLTNPNSDNLEFATGVELGVNSAYGWKSTTGYGFVPPPGLVSADIKALNQGSLRDTTIQILCHSMEQFEIIEKLYLRLGYTMLLEWGWAMYFTNPGQHGIANSTLKNSYHNIATDAFFFNDASSYVNLYAQIETDRKNSNGNYDAVLGVVKNYSWNLERDGSYNITLSLVSVGSVIDSIKSNVSHNTNAASTTSTGDQTSIEYNKDKSTLNKILYYLTTKFDNANLNDVVKDGNVTTAANIGTGIGLTPSQNNDNTSSTIDLARFPFNKLNGVEDNQAYKGEYYMKLGCLLRTIQNFILYYSKDNNNQALINFDFDPEDNFMFTIPRQISLDPRVCLIQPSSKAFENTAGSTTTTFDRQKKGFYATPITYSWQSIEFKDDKNEFGDGKERLIIKDNGYSTIEDWYGGTDSWLYDQPDFEGNTANNKTEAENFLVTNIKPSIVTKTTGEKVILGDDKIPEIFKQNAGSDLQTLLDVYTDVKEGTNDFFDKINPILNGGSAQAGGFSTFKKQYELQSGDVGKTFLVSKPSKSTVEKTFASDEGSNEIHNITIKISTYKVTFWKINNTVDDQLTANAGSSENNDPNYNVNVYDRIKDSDFRISKQDFIGKSMNILVNTNYIAQTLEKYVDISTGNISLYDFLDKLMVGIQNALGNINNFNISYDENKNSFKIIDRTFIPGMNQYKPDLFKTSPAQFITHTLDTSNGSFVRDASVKTKLSNNFATQVSVGAQANGNVVGENATAFSKWNKGLIDRINKDKEATGGTTGNNVEDDYLNNFNIWSTLYGEINQGIVGSKQVEAAKNPCIDLFKYEVGALTNQDIIPGVGFLPIDLELTMDGLSGMKLFESYTADDRLLPANYRDRIQFIITGISHKIANNDWTTTVTSISGPKWDGVVAKEAPNITVLTSNANTTQQSATSPSPSPSTILPPGSSTTENQKSLIKQAADATYVNTPPDAQNVGEPYMCGRGTYNVARNLVELQKGRSATQGQNIRAGGNANSSDYWNKLVALGYTQYNVGNNLTKTQIKDYINNGVPDTSGANQPWVEGDVIVYYSSDNKKFHTQIYVGDWNTSKWACDRKNNYGTGFVYSNPKKYPQNSYTFLVFKAPIAS